MTSYEWVATQRSDVMLERYYDSSSRLNSLRGGPGGRLLETFAGALHEVHYCVRRVRGLIRAAEHLMFFASRKDIAISEINEALVHSFRDHQVRCRCREFHRTEPFTQVFGAKLFLTHLRDTG